MKLSDYFDKIFIICSLESPKAKHTIDTLKLLDLYDDNVIEFYYPTLDDLKVKLDMDNDINDRGQDRISLALSHYSIIKHSYNIGLEKILILEDDNYFFKDIKQWEKVLNNMPKDWDVMKFTGFKFGKKNEPLRMYPKLIKNDIFRKIHCIIDNRGDWGFSAAAIGYNRNSMKVYLDNQEKHFRVADGVYGVFNFENKKYNKLNIYMPMIPLFLPIDDIKKYKSGYYVKYDETNYI